ncbi:MAG: hypothetical protein OES53_02570 [Xanthomonadales bacterium]|jgi:hypothetical protein|nr:hypothetical protein [Xanthomonadales bacterium]MDH3926283.1 hypothetical protein [Xanthomonadales bacterium]MDH3940074.1 hypothetical protein [Xanthomonadales bacterium]MDH4000645.1 hypothetical protein [Xanthomonadales bacterium]
MTSGKKITGLGFLLLSSLVLSTSAWAVNVTLEVDESVNPPSLYVVNNNAQCAGGPIDCIEVESGSQPHMMFKLLRACQPGGPLWGLSGFYVMEEEKNWPAPLDSGTAGEFCANSGTGKVDMNSCGNNQRDDQLKIKNYNRTPGTVYYMVEAKHCTDSGRSPIHLDPEIRNRGGN